jgi:hypothetical protein
MAKRFKIAVDRSVSDSLFRMATPAVVVCHGFGDSSDGDFAPIRQERFEAVDVPCSAWAFGEKPGSECAEGHLGMGLDDLEPFQIQLFPEALLDLRRLPEVARAGGSRIPNAVLIEIAPVDVAALHETHRMIPPLCCC